MKHCADCVYVALDGAAMPCSACMTSPDKKYYKQINPRNPSALWFNPFSAPKKSLTVERIIVNGDATIIFWKDESKTIVKKSADDQYDLHHAFCAALAKRVYGSNSAVKKMIKKKTKVQKAKKAKEE